MTVPSLAWSRDVETVHTGLDAAAGVVVRRKRTRRWNFSVVDSCCTAWRAGGHRPRSRSHEETFDEQPDAVATTHWLRPSTGEFTPAAEIVKDGDDAVIRVELPGVDVDKDVEVELRQDRLVIHGQRRDERAEEKNGRVLREVRYGSFRRSFQLPAHVTSEAVSASYDAGVLTVRVAGAYAGSQAKRIAITKQ